MAGKTARKTVRPEQGTPAEAQSWRYGRPGNSKMESTEKTSGCPGDTIRGSSMATDKLTPKQSRRARHSLPRKFLRRRPNPRGPDRTGRGRLPRASLSRKPAGKAPREKDTPLRHGNRPGPAQRRCRQEPARLSEPGSHVRGPGYLMWRRVSGRRPQLPSRHHRPRLSWQNQSPNFGKTWSVRGSHSKDMDKLRAIIQSLCHRSSLGREAQRSWLERRLEGLAGLPCGTGLGPDLQAEGR